MPRLASMTQNSGKWTLSRRDSTSANFAMSDARSLCLYSTSVNIGFTHDMAHAMLRLHWDGRCDGDHVLRPLRLTALGTCFPGRIAPLHDTGLHRFHIPRCRREQRQTTARSPLSASRERERERARSGRNDFSQERGSTVTAWGCCEGVSPSSAMPYDTTLLTRPNYVGWLFDRFFCAYLSAIRDARLQRQPYRAATSSGGCQSRSL